MRVSCDEQVLAPTDVCLKWGCGRPPLVLLGRLWRCSKCGASYSEDAKKNLSSYLTTEEQQVIQRALRQSATIVAKGKRK